MAWHTYLDHFHTRHEDKTTTHTQQAQAPYLSSVSVEGRVTPAGKREHDVVEAPAADGGALVLGRVDQVLQQARKPVLGAPEI